MLTTKESLPEEEPQQITREYLFHTQEKKYPIRYNKDVFEKF